MSSGVYDKLTSEKNLRLSLWIAASRKAEWIFMNSDINQMLTEAFSYWKWDFTPLDMFSGELAYSLIYNNIKPEKTADAMQTVGMHRLPNYFVLIQIDDYESISKQMEITREFFQKDRLVRTIRNYLSRIGVEGFAANLINSDRIICFVCLQEMRGEEARAFLRDSISRIRRSIYRHTNFTLSVNMSEECKQLSDFPAAYKQMNLNLNQSFYYGEQADLEAAEGERKAVSFDLRVHYTALLAALGQNNRSNIQRRISVLFSQLRNRQAPPQQTRLDIVELVHLLQAYCLRCAIPAEIVTAMFRNRAEEILASQFLSHIQTQISDLCMQIADALKRYSSSAEYQFKLPVQTYLSEHYGESVKLAEVARVFGFSSAYFTQVFKKTFGMTFIQYLTQYRLGKSKKLLKESCLTLDEIAFETGFSNYSYFSTTFKQYMGVSPKAYRKNKQSRG